MKAQLVRKLCRAGRKGTIQRCRADGKTGRSGFDDRSNPLRPVDGAGHHHRFRGDRPTDAVDQIRHVALEAVGEKVEAMHPVHRRQSTGAPGDAVDGAFKDARVADDRTWEG